MVMAPASTRNFSIGASDIGCYLHTLLYTQVAAFNLSVFASLIHHDTRRLEDLFRQPEDLYVDEQARSSRDFLARI